MGLLRRDERGGLQFPEAMDDLPNIGVLGSEHLAALRSNSADDDATRATVARRKLAAAAAATPAGRRRKLSAAAAKQRSV